MLESLIKARQKSNFAVEATDVKGKCFIAALALTASGTHADTSKRLPDGNAIRRGSKQVLQG